MKQTIIFVLLLLCPMLANADAVEVDGIFYNLNSEINGAIVTSAKDTYKGDIVIPNEIELNGQTISVTTIGNEAFANCVDLNSITIPNSVTSIVTGAFSGCSSLTSIKVANGNKVYDSRYDCNAIIETISNTLIVGCKNTIIPYGIETIGFAFQNCNSLTAIEIPNSVKEIVGSFSGCSNLASVNIPNSVTNIGNYSFQGCSSLSSIDIPNSVTSIGMFAFANCEKMSSLTIPSSVSYIGDSAFEQCKGLKTINLSNSLKSIGLFAFAWCHSLNNITIPNGITEILNSSFYFCINLESVIIPKSVLKVGSAFNGCTKLKDVFCYADDVPEADKDAFFISAIDNNPTLHVPAKSIDKYKNASKWRDFGKIVALTEEEMEEYNNNNLVIKNKITPEIEGFYLTQSDGYRDYNGNNTQYGSTFEIQIEDNGNGTYSVNDLLGGWYSQRAGYGNRYAMSGRIEISANGTVSLLNSHVAGWDDGLLSLVGTYDANTLSFTIEAEYVNGMKFYQTWVKSGQIIKYDGINYRLGDNNTASVIERNEKYSGDIVIPQEFTYDGTTYIVSSIGRAFTNCEDLKTIQIPNNITSLEGAFSGCSSLTNVNIPSCVTNIDNAFYRCSSLKTVNIPSSVTYIKGAFQECENLTNVHFPKNLVSIDEYAFDYCSSLTDLLLPDSLIIIGQTCFVGCNSLRTLTIPKNVLYIGPSSFTECEGLETINVDMANAKFDSRANCNAIIETYTNTLILGCKSTTIPQNIIKIGSNAFSGCCDLKSLYMPNSVKSIDFGAFWKCNGLSTFKIGSGVVEIGSGAFRDCEKLETLVIPVSVNNIGSCAFQNCNVLKNVYCYADIVPTTNIDIFIDTPIENVTLHVPANSIEAYKQAVPWKDFGQITALTDDDPKPTGIHSLMNEERQYSVDRYTIGGTHLSQPKRGLNILRMVDGKIKKVIVK